MKTSLFFKGNIEGSVAICNIAMLDKHSTGPMRMILPAEFCSEDVKDCEVSISLKDFNRLEKLGKIIYKW